MGPLAAARPAPPRSCIPWSHPAACSTRRQWDTCSSPTWPTSRFPISSTGRRGVPWWWPPPLALARFTGQHLIAPQTILVRAYLEQIFAGLRDAGLDVFHIVLDAGEEVLQQRIRGSAEAQAWRLDHLAEYRSSRAWMIRAADLTVDTTVGPPLRSRTRSPGSSRPDENPNAIDRAASGRSGRSVSKGGRHLSASAGPPIRSGIEKRHGVAGFSLSTEGRHDAEPYASRREARECPGRMPKPTPAASAPRSVPR